MKFKGKFIEIPLEGHRIKEITYSGLLRIKFDDINENFIDFHSEFIVTRFNQTKKIKPTEKEAVEFFFDHFGELIKEAKAAKTGSYTSFLIMEHN